MQISEKGVTVATGKINVSKHVLDGNLEQNTLDNLESGIILLEKDVYKELRLRGYTYR